MIGAFSCVRIFIHRRTTMNGEQEIFKGKNFSGLLSDIYPNAKKKEVQINSLIKDLQPMIKNIGDATVIVPLIAEYMDISVKNDDHLIKMAAIVQRAMSRSASDSANGVLLTDEEKKQLLDTVNQMEDEATTNG